MGSAKGNFVKDLINLNDEMIRIDETGKIKDGFVDRYGGTMSIANPKCEKEKPWIESILELSKKLVEKGLFNSL